MTGCSQVLLRISIRTYEVPAGLLPFIEVALRLRSIPHTLRRRKYQHDLQPASRRHLHPSTRCVWPIPRHLSFSVSACEEVLRAVSTTMQRERVSPFSLSVVSSQCSFVRRSVPKSFLGPWSLEGEEHLHPCPECRTDVELRAKNQPLSGDHEGDQRKSGGKRRTRRISTSFPPRSRCLLLFLCRVISRNLSWLCEKRKKPSSQRHQRSRSSASPPPRHLSLAEKKEKKGKRKTLFSLLLSLNSGGRRRELSSVSQRFFCESYRDEVLAAVYIQHHRHPTSSSPPFFFASSFPVEVLPSLS